MFYRWAKRLDTLQMPATAFPAAPPDHNVEPDDFELDGALIAASIASAWVLGQSWHAARHLNLDWAVVTFAPIFLVALLAALLLRPSASLKSTAAHVAVIGGLAVLTGLARATTLIGGFVWGVAFALVGLVIAVFCVVLWSAALRELDRPGSMLRRSAPALRMLCLVVILVAALVGARVALAVPLAGL